MPNPARLELSKTLADMLSKFGQVSSTTAPAAAPRPRAPRANLPRRMLAARPAPAPPTVPTPGASPRVERPTLELVNAHWHPRGKMMTSRQVAAECFDGTVKERWVRKTLSVGFRTGHRTVRYRHLDVLDWIEAHYAYASHDPHARRTA